MAHYIYTAITVEETPRVVGEYIIQTIPVNDKNLPVRQASPRPGHGWQALWWQSDSNRGAQHRAHPSNGARMFPDETSARDAAAREAETAAQNAVGAPPLVYLFE